MTANVKTNHMPV